MLVSLEIRFNTSGEFMEVANAKCFMAIDRTRGCWGKAETLAQAVHNAKSQHGNWKKVDMVIVAFTCERTDVQVLEGVDLEYRYPRDTSAVRFTARL